LKKRSKSYRLSLVVGIDANQFFPCMRLRIWYKMLLEKLRVKCPGWAEDMNWSSAAAILF
jgi:hypothetical protein